MPLAADVSITSIASSLARSMVKGVTVRSQVTPDYTYDPWATSPEPPPGNSWLMNFVKPEVTIDTGPDSVPIVVAPYGTPTENYIPQVAIGGVAALVGAVMLIVWIARATK